MEEALCIYIYIYIYICKWCPKGFINVVRHPHIRSCVALTIFLCVSDCFIYIYCIQSLDTIYNYTGASAYILLYLYMSYVCLYIVTGRYFVCT